MKSRAIEEKVQSSIAEALECDPSEVRPNASLMDDLGAESIDLLDINFRIERAFGMKVSDEEMYAGSLKLKERNMLVDGKVTAEGVALIRSKMPDFDLTRFAGGTIYENDLPRLITVETILEYMKRKVAREGSV